MEAEVMRELKFRAWDNESQQFLDVEAHFSNEVSVTPDEWSRGNITPARFLVDQSKITLMQYTGLKDKNGVEIYEGDIVREFDANWQPEEHIFEVDIHSFCGNTGLEPHIEYIQVIGNIYLHPHLLEKSNDS